MARFKKDIFRQAIFAMTFSGLSIAISHCYSLSNFKTAKVLGQTADGKAQISVSGGASSMFGIGSNTSAPQTFSIPASELFFIPEINLRYAVQPGVWEMGNKIYYDTLVGSLGITMDGKYQMYSSNKFYAALDIEVDIDVMLKADGIPVPSLSPAILLTFYLTDWFSLTIAPKVKFTILSSSFGGNITLDIGKEFGIMPELGYYYNVLAASPGSTNFIGYSTMYAGVATRFTSSPGLPKTTEVK